jgi:hypothetical protein
MGMLEYADLYSMGVPPVSGGALDQSHWFLSAYRQIRADESYWLRQLAEHGPQD